MSYVATLTICLLLVYFVSAAGCHCFDLVTAIPASLIQQVQQHSIQTLLSVASGGTFNKKGMKRSVWVRAFKKSESYSSKYSAE